MGNLNQMSAIAIINLAMIAATVADAQQANVAEVPAATVRTVSSGVFGLAQGTSIYIEEQNNQILVHFPNAQVLSGDAYWPGAQTKRKRCAGLATDEYRLFISNEEICVRAGTTFDAYRHIGDWDISFLGGCQVDVVQVEQAEPFKKQMTLRAECAKIEPAPR